MNIDFKIAQEGEMCEAFLGSPIGKWLIAKLEERADNLVNRRDGKVIRDLEQINFDNGRRAGILDIIAYCKNAVDLKNRELEKTSNPLGE
ncbi:MAG: hypothetical protein WC356_03805 [Candidatus Micrarchaeia archaeon]